MTINQHDQWLGVELRHLAALEAVVEEGSFGRAARRLGYTQSAVSQQIAQLEKVVGAKLLERPGGPRAVSPTDAGRLLLRHADAIVALPFGSRQPPRILGLAWHKERYRSPAAERFVELAGELAASLQ